MGFLGFFCTLFSMAERSVTALRVEPVSAAQIAQRWKFKTMSAYGKKTAVLEKGFCSCVATAISTTISLFCNVSLSCLT